MSSMNHNAPGEEHGTTTSYIVGFVLSLVFTIIPYYLVVNHVVSGMALLVTILGIAVLQMIIQIVFFLHLGREKRPHWQLSFFVSTVGIVLVVVVGSIWIMHHLHYNMTPVTPADASKKLVEDEGIYQLGGEKTGACRGVHTNYKVTIKDGQVSPALTSAQQCDTLTFINEDKDTHHMVFGQPGYPAVYAGSDMVMVYKGHPKTITLGEQGTYHFYDHMHTDKGGSFTVTPN